MSITDKRKTGKKSVGIEFYNSPTDVGNGRRLAQAHGRDLRYVHAWKRWLVWDGKRWATENQLEVERRAKKVAASIYREAADEENDDRRRELADHARATESAQRIAAMISVARSECYVEDGIERAIEAKTDELDSHPFLLNVENGTLDLRTGQLGPHRREDMLTKLAPVVYDAGAEPLHWLRFISKTLANDAEMISYVQKLLGYSLAASAREHLLPIIHGPGQNGKSTLFNAMLAMLGPDYALKVSETLLTPGRDGTPAHEVAELFGKRFVVCIETQEGRRLNESLVKEITGGDTLRGCRKYENGFNFRPTHTVWMATNHMPDIKGRDEGIWRRLKRIPFDVRISEADRDPELSEKLYAERAGILAWCVQGCLDWLRQGRLVTPAKVAIATDSYRAEQDTLAAFLRECCIELPDAKARFSQVYDRYVTWQGHGHSASQKEKRQLSAQLKSKFQEYADNGLCFRGLGLLTESRNDKDEMPEVF
jgi:putative DNA primase/helicase